MSLITLSYETVAEDGVFLHPYYVPWNMTELGDDDALPLPAFRLCRTELPAYLCTCGRYLLEVAGADDEEPEPPW
jgi:hypothetical protein